MSILGVTRVNRQLKHLIESRVRRRAENVQPFRFARNVLSANYPLGLRSEGFEGLGGLHNRAEILKLANECRVSVIRRGRDSSLSGGPLPLSGEGPVLILTGLEEVLEVNIDDSYVEAEAGVIINDLNVLLASHGYMSSWTLRAALRPQ